MDSDHRRRWRRAVPARLAVICTAVTGLVVPVSHSAGAAPAQTVATRQANSDDEARAARRAVDRASAILENATSRARNAAKQLAAARAALPGAQQRVAEARGRVAAAQAVANTARRKADAAQAAYQVVAARVGEAQRRVDQARRRVEQLVSATYKGSTFTAINILVEATGPGDAIDRLGYVDQVITSQQADVEELMAARREARVAQDEAGVAKRAAELAERLAQQALDDAQAAHTHAVRARAEVVALTARCRTALAVARVERRAVLRKYRQAKAEEARIRSRLRGVVGGGTASLGSGGRLLMPVHGWKSSNFGMRFDPYYRVWQLHAGTDFAAGHGTAIHAAASGRVVQAGYNGGYGNYTCISHGRYRGRNLSTCYGHQSRIGVHRGEYVSRGEVIGRVGTTGASTGNHLHFEVRLDGVPHDPLRYLPACLC